MVLSKINKACPDFLAPMTRFTNLPFRLLCKKYGCDIVVTEMTSAAALCYINKQRKGDISFLNSIPDEQPVGIQLYGRDPKTFRNSIHYIQKLERFSFIDINAGCPAINVRKQGAGALLLRDIDKLREIIETCTSVSDLPVSLKIRLGWSRTKDVSEEVIKIAEKESVDFVTIHGRYGVDKYNIPADWSRIYDIKKQFDIPIIGNGDINSTQEIKRLKDTHSVDGLMIGRAARGNPKIFSLSDVVDENGIQKNELPSEFFEYLDLVKSYCPSLPYHYVKRMTVYFSKKVVNSSVFRRELQKTKKIEELMNLINKIY